MRDITQAYLQSEADLSRPVYLKLPLEMHLPDGKLLRAKKPLYGIPESGRLWFETYHRHHLESLKMQACVSDPCLLFGSDASDSGHRIPNIVVLQVDDCNDVVGLGGVDG